MYIILLMNQVTVIFIYNIIKSFVQITGCKYINVDKINVTNKKQKCYYNILSIYVTIQFFLSCI